MLEIQVCVGSSCHIRGSALIIRQLQDLIRQRRLEKEIRLKASFCMGECRDGVCLTVNGEKVTGVTAANLDAVFAGKVLGQVES